MDGDRTFSIDMGAEGGGEEGEEGEEGASLELSVGAKLINDMTMAKLNGWVLTRLRAGCEKRKRGTLRFRTEEQEARAALTAAARARGATRRAGGSRCGSSWPTPRRRCARWRRRWLRPAGSDRRWRTR